MFFIKHDNYGDSSCTVLSPTLCLSVQVYETVNNEINRLVLFSPLYCLFLSLG